MDLLEVIKSHNVYQIGEMDVSDIVFNTDFRDICATNACGMYGKCWMCPPTVGDIDTLIASAKSFKKAIVYQNVYDIEDSYDIESMLEGGVKHNAVAHKINDYLRENFEKSEYLHLGAGGCKTCKTCAKREDKPCRFPEKAMASLESYGIAVSQLAESSNMKYINGQNTVTYFSAILLK